MEVAFAQFADEDLSAADDARTPRRQPRLRVGFDTVEGAPRYASRSVSDSGAATVRFSATRPRTDGFVGGVPDRLPVTNGRLSSRYGSRTHPASGRRSAHAGVDLAVATGTPVTATADGKVSRAGWAGGYSMLITIDHGNEVVTYYGHLSAIAVRPGDAVQKGQVIGRSGSTGRSTGPHVHYEVRVEGVPIDPLPPA